MIGFALTRSLTGGVHHKHLRPAASSLAEDLPTVSPPMKQSRPENHYLTASYTTEAKQMRISVLADESGKIVATLRPVEAAGNRPTEPHMRVGPGQKVHHVLLPPELLHLRSLVSLHDTYRVEVTGPEAHLVARQ